MFLMFYSLSCRIDDRVLASLFIVALSTNRQKKMNFSCLNRNVKCVIRWKECSVLLILPSIVIKKVLHIKEQSICLILVSCACTDLGEVSNPKLNFN